ncbi:MAG: glycosyltransferase family 1 protein [Cytophagaceae bacterium]
MKPIAVALECSALCHHHPTGISVYTHQLLHQLQNNPERVVITPFYKEKFFKKKNFNYDLPAQSYLHRSLARLGNNVLTHSTDSKFLYSKKRKNIVTIHDVAIFMKENEMPDYTDERMKMKTWKLNLEIAKYADKIITVSEKTKQDFCNIFGATPEKVVAIPLGFNSRVATESINDEHVLTTYNLRKGSYFLFVGAISIRKNILNILKAYKQSGLYENWPLVLAGPDSMGSSTIAELKQQLGLNDYVRQTQYLSEASIQALYRNAGGFVFPTFYEGFGLPILEAFSHGIPVLTSTKGAAPEVSGGHARLVDPFSVEEIANGLHNLMNSRPNPDALKQYANSFSWAKTAQKTIEVYQSLV